MKHFTLLLTILCCTMSVHAQVDITFRVDMSGQSVSADGVHVAGDINGWSTSDNPLTDQGDGIYMATVSLDPGRDIQYKYLNGNAWGTEESAPSDCTIGGSNRIFTVPNVNDTLDLVPFNGCQDVVPTNRVSFRVDMNNETPSVDGVHVAGNFVGWDPGIAQMVDQGDGIYELEVDVLASILTVQYKFVNGNAWGNEESIPDGCKNAENNRFAPINADNVILAAYVFGSCDTTALTTSMSGQLSPDLYQLVIDPVNQILSLQLTPELGQTQLRILDVQGRVMMQKSVLPTASEVDFQLSLADWPKGLYILQAESRKGAFVKRFMSVR